MRFNFDEKENLENAAIGWTVVGAALAGVAVFLLAWTVYNFMVASAIVSAIGSLAALFTGQSKAKRAKDKRKEEK
jgi:hypothetical protein